jgi:hypothetical protein
MRKKRRRVSIFPFAFLSLSHEESKMGTQREVGGWVSTLSDGLGEGAKTMGRFAAVTEVNKFLCLLIT